jgi:hypothetical protein
MYEVEFRIPTATYAYVNLKITASHHQELWEELDKLQDDLALKLGRTGAALIGAVNHGHANPGAVPVDTDEPPVPDATQLIKSELGGKVVAVEAAQAASQQEPEGSVQVTQEKPAEVPSRPWNRHPETVQQKPWNEEPPKTAPKTGGLDDFFA